MATGAIQSRKRISRIHRTFAVIVGLQLLMWTAGGLFMVAAPIKTVRSEHQRTERPAPSIAPEVMAQRIKALDVAPISVAAVSRAGRDLIEVRSSKRGYWLIAPESGDLVDIDEGFVRAEALAATKGAPRVATVALLTGEAPIEWRRAMPVWQVKMAEPSGLNLYIDPHNGQVRAWRSDLWRVFDFFWMMHIMDYDGRDNLNNWLVRIFAASALMFVLSGFALLWVRMRARGMI